MPILLLITVSGVPHRVGPTVANGGMFKNCHYCNDQLLSPNCIVNGQNYAEMLPGATSGEADFCMQSRAPGCRRRWRPCIC